jgi:hypothetical protein
MRRFVSFLIAVTLSAALSPAANPPETNAQAFLFVLEFGLGSPLAAAPEKIIRDELLSAWRGKSEAELGKFDAYPRIVAMILALKPADLEPFRKTIEETTRQWLDESPAGDPAVKAVRAQLEAGGRVLKPGAPPLTEMIAAAYSEMIVFARILSLDPAAAPDRISAPAAAATRRQVLAAWDRFSEQDRLNLASVPALWMTMRNVLRYGGAEDRTRIRAQIARLAPAADEANPLPSGEIGKKIINSMVLSDISRQTFNSYMWSRGYSGWTPMGKF